MSGDQHDSNRPPDKPSEQPSGLSDTTRIAFQQQFGDLPQLSQPELLAILENTEDAIVLCDSHSKPIFWNRQYAALIERFVGEPMQPGFRPSQILSDEQQQYWKALSDRALRGERFTEEYHHTYKGQTWVLEISYCPVEANGKVVGYTEATRDITARYLLENQRREMVAKEVEAEYRRLLDHMSTAITIHRPNGEIRMCNRAAERLLGMSEAEIIGTLVEDPVWWVTDESANRLPWERYPVAHAIASGEPVRDEVYGLMVADRPEPTWILCNAYPDFGNDGQLEQVVLTFSDISERKRQEDELRHHHLETEREKSFLSAQLSSILANAPIFIAVLDREGRFRYVNRVIEGLTMQDVLSSTTYDFVPEEYRETIRERIERTFETGKIEYYETKGLGPDGELGWWYETWLCPIEIDGVVRYVSQISNDILLRKREELKQQDYQTALEAEVQRRTEELQRQTRDLRVSQQVARLGSYDLDIPRGLWRSSEMLDRIFGIEYREWHTIEDWHNLIHPEWREKMSRYFSEQVVGRGERFDKEYQIVRLDTGEARWVHGQGELIFDESDQPVRMLGTIMDITERKRLEAEGLRAQKLESLGVLAGGIAHDFNNLLAALLSSLQLIRLEVEDRPELLRDLQNAETACLRASDLTQQLLTFSKGGKPLTRPTQLTEPLQDWVRFALRGSRISAAFEIDENLPAVEADLGQLHQVVNNLVINAVQAMPEGGTITVSAHPCRVGPGERIEEELLPAGKYVRIAVQDTGVGIAPEHMPRIFDPFFTTKPEGTGLGLASAYSIVKNHRGLLRAQSSAGEGSEFEILLPATEEPPGKAAEPTEAANRGSGLVLLVDDDLSLRNILGKLIGRLGYRVEAAASGEEALEIYRQGVESGERPDAVILDLTIPGKMGGEAAVQELLRLDPQAQAIVTSGYAESPVLANYTDYGFKARLSKPYRIEELGEILQHLIG